MHRLCLALLGILAFSGAALASPGHGDDADSAQVERGALDLSLTYHRLTGGSDDGDNLLQVAATFGAGRQLRLGAQASFEQSAGGSRKAETVGFEALYALGQVGPIDLAVYGTFDLGIERPDSIEARFIAQHQNGPLDIRFNLIGTKNLAAGEKLELGYAVAADVQVMPRLQLGLHGFGEFGSLDDLLPNGGHAFGPVARYELGGPVQVNLSYLITVGAARQDTKGQLRLGLEIGL